MSDRTAELARLCMLHHPVRRALYEFVVAQARPVSRDAAARAASIPRRLAAFHLDRLADAGLLVTSFRRLSGRRGPGAGRPAKLYERVDAELVVTLPPREYAIAGEVLAGTVEALGEQAGPVLAGIARDTGARLARESGERDPSALLAALGYEPYGEGDRVRLRNCPFHRLAERHRETVCTANRHLLAGALGGRYDAVLSPARGHCCVELHPAGDVRRVGA